MNANYRVTTTNFDVTGSELIENTVPMINDGNLFFFIDEKGGTESDNVKVVYAPGYWRKFEKVL